MSAKNGNAEKGHMTSSLLSDAGDEQFRRKLQFSPISERSVFSEHEDNELIHRPTEKDRGLDGVDDANTSQDTELPYSVARCVALVVTVCGASFTDVSTAMKSNLRV